MTGVQARVRAGSGAGNLAEFARMHELIGQSIREGELSYQQVARELGIEAAQARALWPGHRLDELIGRWLLESGALVREPDAQLKLMDALAAFRMWVFSLDGGPTIRLVEDVFGTDAMAKQLRERLVEAGARWDSRRWLLRGARLI